VVASIVATVILAVLLDVVTTLRVARSDVYTGVQKSLQIVVIWTVPLAGAGVVLLVMMSDRMIPKPRRSSDAGDINAYAGGYGNGEGRSNHGGSGHGGDGGAGGHGGA
jgi:hypothetical protein